MKTVILCGGYGTRIRGVADDIPKPMIPIGEKPILWHIMKSYSMFGYNDFVLCLGYKSDVIKDFFLNYNIRANDMALSLHDGSNKILSDCSKNEDWNIIMAETGLNAKTGARIQRIKKYIDEDVFLLTYGDGVGDVDINQLVRFHKSHGRLMTVTGVRPPGRFGELSYGSDACVSGFNEKPQASGGRINGGFFVCNRGVFDYLNDDEELIFEELPIKALVDDKELMVYEHDGFWQPMDTFREYSLLNDLYKQNKAPWIKW